MTEGQEPTVLAVGKDGLCLGTFLFRLSYLFSFSLYLREDGPIYNEILSQRTVKCVLPCFLSKTL